MSKIKLRIQLDESFEVDLKGFSFEGLTEEQIKKELIRWYFHEIGTGEVDIKMDNSSSILGAVQNYEIDYNIEFYEIEYHRELTISERANIINWVMSGQKGKLKI